MLVTVFIKLVQEVNRVILKTGIVLCGCLDLGDNGAERGLGEDLAVVFHVLFGVFVCRDQHELETDKRDSATNHEIALDIVFTSNWRQLLFALHESATNATAVFVANFVNLDGVVATIEGDNESAGLIIGLSGDKFGVEAKDVHVLFEHFLHVVLWWFRLKSDH